jgi:hypothetical protein
MMNSLWSRPAPDELASYMIIVPDHGARPQSADFFAPCRLLGTLMH